MMNTDESQYAQNDEYNKVAPGGNIETNWKEIAEKLGVPEVSDSFDKMNLNEDILRGIYTYGFEHPSSIQQRGIMAVGTGKHIIAQAQSGTGKTATFCVGTLNRIDLSNKNCQVLVLAPTRELANQIYDVLMNIGVQMTAKGFKAIACVGGTSVEENRKKLKAGVHMVVGTPGRVKHMIENDDLKLNHLKSFVLDEADEMLSRGFKEQISDVLNSVRSHDFQICLFSATLDPETLQIADRFMRDPIMILVKKEEVTLEGITQFYVTLTEEWKYEILTDIYSSIQINQCIIYCNTKAKAEKLAHRMLTDDHVVACMHGDMEDGRRRQIMNDFRTGLVRVLITTDLNSRGIDVQGVSLVINYDLPLQKETYIHRIGRSGRFGRKGTAINFVVGMPNDSEVEMMSEIEKYYMTDIQELRPKDFEELPKSVEDAEEAAAEGN